MTVPALMQNHQKKTYVTQLHKVYNQLSQAVVLYMTDRNALNLKEAGLTNGDAIDAFMKKYFKIVQDCTADISECANSSEYKKMDGTSNPIFRKDSAYSFKYYILADGSLIGLLNYGDNKIQVNVDVNGKKGPNIIGRDTFAFNIYSNGIIDDECSSPPCTEEERETMYNKNCISSSTTGWFGCFGKILNDNWEMTY